MSGVSDILDGIQKFRLLVFLVFGVPFLLLVGGVATYVWLTGDGDVRVVAPTNEELRVVLDGGREMGLPPNASERLKLPQGEHELVLTLASGATVTHHIEVASGFWEGLATAPGQCMVQLDVTDSFYGDEPDRDGQRPLPEVEVRIGAEQVEEISSSVYIPPVKLPSQTSGHVRLLQQVDCGLLQLDDEGLTRRLGYEGYVP